MSTPGSTPSWSGEGRIGQHFPLVRERGGLRVAWGRHVNHLKRFAGFALVPMLSLASSLLLLPLITQRFGPAGLSALTVSQSLGAIASVVVGLAWPIVGGQQVAAAPDLATRRSLLAHSYATRAFVLLICAVPTAVASAVLAPDFRVEAAMFGIAVACNGLTSGWYFAGTGEPLPVIVFEGVTRLGAYAVALTGMALGLGIWVYAAAMLTWAPVMTWLNWRHVMRGREGPVLPSLRLTVRLVREQSLGTVSRLAQSAFSFGGPPIFAGVAPGSLAGFSAADQIQKSATGGSFAVINAFINWVGVGTKPGRRSVLAMGVCAAGSALFLSVWWFLGGPFMQLIFSGKIPLTDLSVDLLGLAVVAVFLVRSMELLVMVPLGLERLIYQANTVVSLLGLAAMALVAPVWGVPGGLVVVNLCSVATMAVFGCRLLLDRAREQRSQDPGVASYAGPAGPAEQNGSQE